MADNRRGSRARSRSPSIKGSRGMIQIEMPKLDILFVGPANSGKTSLAHAFSRDDEQQSAEADPQYLNLGMNVVSQYHQLGVGTLEQWVNLNLWDPAMRELTSRETTDKSLIGINGQLRVRFQKDCKFHGIIVCYDCTNGESFTSATKLYKELIKDPEDETKLSDYARIPVAFVGTKLDLTNFLKSDPDSLPKCVQANEMKPWLQRVHRKAENACFETSAKENIGVSIMMDWIVRAALRVHPKVEKAKFGVVKRFTGPVPQSAKGNLKILLANAEGCDFDEEDEEVIAAKNQQKQQRWKKYQRDEAMTAPRMNDLCSIF